MAQFETGREFAKGNSTTAPPLAGQWVNYYKDLKKFRGIILVHFWAHTCVHCLLDMPFLKKLWSVYRSKNFLLVGVHTPEFEFEKNPSHVKEALKKLDISWPVILDNNHELWNAFGSRQWPAKYIIDERGKIAYVQFGEGAGEAEQILRKLLGLDERRKINRHHSRATEVTPDTYAGFLKGKLANAESRNGTSFIYQPPFSLSKNELALSGEFILKSEYAETEKNGAALNIHMKAKQAFAVLESVSTEATVEVLFKNKPLPENLRGKDVSIQSTVIIDGPRLFQIVNSHIYHEGILTLRARHNNFRAYVLRFSE